MQDLSTEGLAQQFPLPAVKDVSMQKLSTLHAAYSPSRLHSNSRLFSYLLLQVDQFEREVVEMVKPCHGTTTLGFIFEHGVIIAVDSRATMGSYICKCAATQIKSAAVGWPAFVVAFTAYCIPHSWLQQCVCCSLHEHTHSSCQVAVLCPVCVAAH